MGLEKIVHGLAAIIAAVSICCSPASRNISIETPEKAGCKASYGKDPLVFRCGGIEYDTGKEPINEERKFLFEYNEVMVTKDYETTVEGEDGPETYFFRTEQKEGDIYPRTVVLETPQDHLLLGLDEEGNVTTVITMEQDQLSLQPFQ